MLVFTPPMQRVLTPELRTRIQRALSEFPELAGRTITVGLNTSRRLDGSAIAERMLIRLNASRRRVSYFTIGHELTHLLQRPGLGTVPSGEVQCDVWTLARGELFLDDQPTYLRLPCRRRDWWRHAGEVRRFCVEALQQREDNRRYLAWLERQIRAYFARPFPRDLFDVDLASSWKDPS
jgi:hypothetical protein